MITLTATITKLDGSFITLDYRNSMSLERNIQDRSDFKLPSFGIISNGGNLRFVDADGSVRFLAEQRQLKSGMAVNFYLNNTVSGASAPVGKFLTNQWDYDNNNKEVTVSLMDDLQEWQDLLITPVEYNPYFDKDLSFKWYYEYLYALTPSKYNLIAFSDLDEATQTVLSATMFEFFILNSKSIWGAWENLCEACQCHIYKRNDGKTTCRYNGGN